MEENSISPKCYHCEARKQTLIRNGILQLIF